MKINRSGKKKEESKKDDRKNCNEWEKKDRRANLEYLKNS